MWLLLKKMIGYVALLVAVSLFGFELFPGKDGTGTKELPTANDEVKELLAAQVTPGEQKNSLSSATPASATKPVESAPMAVTETTPSPGSRASSGPTGKPAAQQSTSPKPSGKALVHLNKAGIKELSALPRIGETRAKAIMDYRQSHGGFKSVDELEKVKGIGTKTMELLRPLVTLD